MNHFPVVPPRTKKSVGLSPPIVPARVVSTGKGLPTAKPHGQFR